jgi:Cu+-exporting ATPase
VEKKASQRCFHCGDDCGDHPVVADGKSFCCQGCRTVYEILKEKDACEYYNIQDFPGTRAADPGMGKRFAYLDNREIASSLLDFSDGGISRIRFFIPSIHCSSCIWLLENLNRFSPGILHSAVNFTRKEVTINYREGAMSLRQVVELLAAINYEPHISRGTVDEKKQRRIDRKIYYQLGIAGFCFGNIMLFSFPEYLAGEGNLEIAFRSRFAFLNLILAIPVVFYSASDYFISAFRGLRKRIVNIDVPIALGVTALFMRSAYDIMAGIGPGYMDSLSGLVFFLLIGKWYQGKTYQALSFERDYRSYFPVAVTVLDDAGEETTIPLNKLAIGHRILVRNQDLIPADAILVDGRANIDYSFVTGESTPVLRQQRERIFAGGRQIGGAIQLIVEKNVDQGYLTGLWNQDLHGKPGHRDLNSIVNIVSRYFTLIILLTGLGTAAWWYFHDPARAINAFTAVLIVACPCALALTIPFTFGSAMRAFGKRGFYLKKTDVIEVLSKIDTIVFDKTGTLTVSDAVEIDPANVRLGDDEVQMVRALVRHSSHPLSMALYRWLPDDEGSSAAGRVLSATGFMEEIGQGIKGEIDGHDLMVGNAGFATGKEHLTDSEAARIFVSIDGRAKGYYLIRNRYRKGISEVIGKLQGRYRLHLLSGDNEAERPYLEPLFGPGSRLNFRQSPAQKLEYVRGLRREPGNILMVGDGLNDAGALKESHVGITIADNVYHFSPACDAILDADRIDSLPGLLSFSRQSMLIVKAGFALSFIYNITGIAFAASGMLSPLVSAILMPLSSVSVVAFATLSTNLLARIRLSNN